MLGSDMNDNTPRDGHLHIQVMRTPDAKEIIPQIKHGVDPLVSLSQTHERIYM
jgi:hypothetical protein